jgi:hypothetical protein
MYRKSVRQARLESKRVRCSQMRAAKERKRIAAASMAECVGSVVFDGAMFGGRHEMRLLCSEAYSDRYMMVEIDGHAHRPRSVEGLRRLIARRLS